MIPETIQNQKLGVVIFNLLQSGMYTKSDVEIISAYEILCSMLDHLQFIDFNSGFIVSLQDYLQTQSMLSTDCLFSTAQRDHLYLYSLLQSLFRLYQEILKRKIGFNRGWPELWIQNLQNSPVKPIESLSKDKLNGILSKNYFSCYSRFSI
jgi:hypothetical protein